MHHIHMYLPFAFQQKQAENMQSATIPTIPLLNMELVQALLYQTLKGEGSLAYARM